MPKPSDWARPVSRPSRLEGLIGGGAAPAVLAYLFPPRRGPARWKPHLADHRRGLARARRSDLRGAAARMVEGAAQEERQRGVRHPVLADIEKSAIAPAIIESCPTRLFLRTIAPSSRRSWREQRRRSDVAPHGRCHRDNPARSTGSRAPGMPTRRGRPRATASTTPGCQRTVPFPRTSGPALRRSASMRWVPTRATTPWCGSGPAIRRLFHGVRLSVTGTGCLPS